MSGASFGIIRGFSRCAAIRADDCISKAWLIREVCAMSFFSSPGKPIDVSIARARERETEKMVSDDQDLARGVKS